jgi:hypothetical protein
MQPVCHREHFSRVSNPAAEQALDAPDCGGAASRLPPPTAESSVSGAGHRPPASASLPKCATLRLGTQPLDLSALKVAPSSLAFHPGLGLVHCNGCMQRGVELHCNPSCATMLLTICCSIPTLEKAQGLPVIIYCVDLLWKS